MGQDGSPDDEEDDDVDAYDDDIEVSQSEFLQGSGVRQKRQELRVIEVLECNMDAVNIFRMCQLTYVGMGGHCLGFAAKEIQAAFEIVGRSGEELFYDVKYMGSVAAMALNARTKQQG